jgi:hypothetical protein
MRHGLRRDQRIHEAASRLSEGRGLQGTAKPSDQISRRRGGHPWLRRCAQVRWGAGAKGKSGGVRVIYYWVRADDQIFLLTIYGKNEKADLSAADLKRVVRLLEELTNG